MNNDVGNENGSSTIPVDRLERNPLMTEEGYRLFNRIRQHPFAPKWNYEVGDRVIAADLLEVDNFRKGLKQRPCWEPGAPPRAILSWIEKMRDRTPAFRERLYEGFDPTADWNHIPTMDREDAAVRPEELAPDDADLSRLIVYDTSGTTGHALVVPHHPVAMAKYLPMVEFVLSRYDLHPNFGPHMTACVNVTARTRTVTFPNVFSVWNQAGFAKVNLHPSEWADREAARRFFQDLSPYYLAGDPVGLAEMIRWNIDIRPAGVISTAVTLNSNIKDRLSSWFKCPVIDWYSTTETGPVAYTCRYGYRHVLPHDIYLELIDETGYPVDMGEMGEITVTGGRNPYLPLLRYRTGDRARFAPGDCSCGDKAPRFEGLEGRPPVAFQASDGSVVSQVDVGLVMRECLFLQHEMIQRVDGSVDLRVRPAPGTRVDVDGLESKLRNLFGKGIELRIREDKRLGEDGAKVMPYRTYEP